MIRIILHHVDTAFKWCPFGGLLTVTHLYTPVCCSPTYICETTMTCLQLMLLSWQHKLPWTPSHRESPVHLSWLRFCNIIQKQNIIFIKTI